MIINSFGSGSDVTGVWDIQHSNGGYIYDPEDHACSSIYDYNNTGVIPMLRLSGLSPFSIGTNFNEAEKILNNCGLILAGGYLAFPCQEGTCWGGHIIVITGISKTNGQVTHIQTMDPWYSDGNNRLHQLNQDYRILNMWAVVP